MSVSFQPGFKNQLLMNPKISEQEKNILQELKNKFEENFSKQNYFLVASSGSSQKLQESVKLFALSLDAILNSAKRFNDFFSSKPNQNWGLVLPTFHVAGLSILARAHLVGAKVVTKEWSIKNLSDWLQNNQVAFLSLVPAQVYEIVQNKIQAAKSLKKIFVGAGVLNGEIREEFIRLGWPLVETYGMTETCSMIAVKEIPDAFFKTLPDVKIKTDEDKTLSVLCNSVAFAFIQKVKAEIILTRLNDGGWFQTEDQALIHQFEQRASFQFIGRKSEYIKILGEGVSLSELRENLDRIAFALKINSTLYFLFAKSELRRGHNLILVVSGEIDKKVAQNLFEMFNKTVRPYEKIQKMVQLDEIPRTSLGKVKVEELNKIL